MGRAPAPSAPPAERWTLSSPTHRDVAHEGLHGCGEVEDAVAVEIGRDEVPGVVTPILANATPGMPCTQRPNVTVQAVPGQPGELNVTIGATSGAGILNNQLVQLQFTTSTNALIDVPGQPVGQVGNFNAAPTAPLSTGFRVRRGPQPNASTHVNLVVVDRCGSWPTFVGGRRSAF